MTRVGRPREPSCVRRARLLARRRVIVGSGQVPVQRRRRPRATGRAIDGGDVYLDPERRPVLASVVGAKPKSLGAFGIGLIGSRTNAPSKSLKLIVYDD